mmetsp:Transcript_7697/g.28359  ORF Transcript_7697/g.28359 Transcript_7697/m.28359 type:complete len:1164 (+) Transcript_7697:1563-5054(+)|eukprot:scaffold843_cov327-Prasinococcus_capsulatus_cf.AAC.1
MRKLQKDIKFQGAFEGEHVAKEEGTICLNCRTETGALLQVQINDVVYLPTLRTNLLSWRILREQGFQFQETSTHLELSINNNNIIIPFMKNVPRLFYEIPTDSKIQLMALERGLNINEQYHIRMGHAAYEVLDEMARYGQLPGYNPNGPKPLCPVCQMAKMRVAPSSRDISFEYRQTINSAEIPGDVVQFDFKSAPRSTAAFAHGFDSKQRAQVSFVLIDIASRMVFHEALQSKSDATKVFKHINQHHFEPHQWKIKIAITDNETSALPKSLRQYCEDNNIKLMSTARYTSKQLSHAERVIQTIDDTSRAILLGSGRPQEYWGWGRNHATYIYNRKIHSSLNGRSPLDVFLRKTLKDKRVETKLQNVPPFGYPVWYLVPTAQRPYKAAAHAKLGVYLGQSKESNDAIILANADELSTNPDATPTYVLRRSFRIDIEWLPAWLWDMLQRPTMTGPDNAPTQLREEPELPPAEAGEEDISLDIDLKTRHDSDDDEVTPDEHNDDSNDNQDAPIRKSPEWDLYIDLSADNNETKDNTNEGVEPETDTEEVVEQDGTKANDPATNNEDAEPQKLAPSPPHRPTTRSMTRKNQQEAEANEPHEVDIMALDEMIETGNSEYLIELLALGRDPAKEPTLAEIKQMTPEDQKPWLEAMKKELDELNRLETFEVVRRSSIIQKKQRIISGKWVFVTKADGRRKARWVLKGFLQQKNVNFTEIFAPVTRSSSVRMILSWACSQGWYASSGDITNAYVNSPFDHDLYVDQPAGLELLGGYGRYPKGTYVLKVLKALYGARQSSRLFCKHLENTLLSLGWTQIVCDNCVYKRENSRGEVYMILAVYVDDILVVSSDSEAMDDFWRKLNDLYRLKMSKELNTFLGMQIEYNREDRQLRIHQERYALEIITKFGLDQSPKVVDTPVPVGWQQQENSQILIGAKLKEYQSMVGSLLYLSTQTRPDIAYLMHILCKGMSQPTRCLMKLARRGLQYIKNTLDWGLNYGQSTSLRGFSDSDYAGDIGDRKSLTGFVFMWNGASVNANSKKQTSVALSTCEAELYALTRTTQEALFIKHFLTELKVWNSNEPMTIMGDNSCSIQLTKDPVHHPKVKHIAVKYFFIRDEVKKGSVKIEKVETTYNLADLFTKPLGRDRFRFLARQILGMLPEDKTTSWTTSFS